LADFPIALSAAQLSRWQRTGDTKAPNPITQSVGAPPGDQPLQIVPMWLTMQYGNALLGQRLVDEKSRFITLNRAALQRRAGVAWMRKTQPRIGTAKK
jgi:hypothetical protein